MARTMSRLMGWIGAALLAGASAAGAQGLPCDATLAAHAASRVAGDWRSAVSVRVGAAFLHHGPEMGVVPDGMRLERMILLLEPTAEQKAALDAELAAGACGFQKRLTAAEFADRFAVSETDAGEVESWLRSEGFAVAALPAERGWVEFSGTAAQVKLAFDAEVRRDASKAGRYVLSGAIAVPAALAPVIHGLVLPDESAEGSACVMEAGETRRAYCAVLARQETAEDGSGKGLAVADATPAAVTIKLTASPTALTPGLPEAFTAVLAPAAGSTGSDNITGTVSFYDGTTLLGQADVNSYAATLSSIMLDTTKSHVITAVYSGDANWAAVTSAPLTLAAFSLADTVTLTVTPATVGPGQSVTFTVTVAATKKPDAAYEQNPTGVVTFYSGTGDTQTAVATATLVASVGNSSTATWTSATLPAGVNTITAAYAGDDYFAAGTSSAVTVSVQDFTVAVTTPSSGGLTIAKGASGAATITIGGAGGYANQVQVTCNVPGQDYITCTPSPVQVTPTGTVTFTVQTFATGGPAVSSVTNPARGGSSLLRAAGGVVLALLAMVAPVGWRARRWIAMVVLAAGLIGAGVGCGDSGGSGPVSGGGTALGTTTLTITATAYVNQAVVSHQAYLTVNVVPGQ